MLAAIYFASAVLKATDFCFLLIQDIEADPKVKQHPEVLLRSTTLPAQSASVYPGSLTSPTVYLNPLCHEDISEDSWHQSSEAQPNMSS